MTTKDEDVDELFQKLRPIFGEKIDLLWLAYQVSPKQRKNIEAALRILSARYLNEDYKKENMLLFPPEKHTAFGKYKLGKVVYNHEELYPFGLRENEMNQHVSIFGRSGSGKTNICHILIWNLLKDKKPFLIFDWKRNYRNLILTPEGKETLIFTPGTNISPFYFNPLIPPANLSKDKYLSYIREVVSLICESYFPHLQLLSVQGVEYLLLKAIEGLITCAQKLDFKNMFSWLERSRLSFREKDWRTSSLNCLYKLSTGSVGEVFNHEAFPLEYLLEKPVILELDNFGSPKDKRFLIESLLLWLYHYRMGERKSPFKHLILMEEAHHVLLKKQQESAGEESITDIILRQIRQYGESVVIVDQHPSLTSIPGLGNTYCTICLNLKSSEDIDKISGSLLVRKSSGYLTRLPVGQGIVKLQGRHFQPFLVKFPLFSSEGKEIEDREVETRMSSFFRELGLNQTKEDKPEVVQGFYQEERTMTQEEKVLLEDVAEHPLSNIVERYNRLGFFPHKGNRVRALLIRKDLIQMHNISTHTGRVKVLTLTEKGKEVVETMGLKTRTLPQNASFEHEYWKEKAARYFKTQGYGVEKEKHIGQNVIDVVARNKEEYVAVEVETGKSQVIYNIEKDLEAGFDRIICLLTDKEVKEKIKKQLEETEIAGDRRIKIIHVGELNQRLL